VRRSSKPSRRSGCPIGIALDMLGDPWTLLVVRDLMFKGGKTFGEFLSGGEGIATNILTDRLNRLEANGIVERRRDPADARRHICRLTKKGIDLAPVMVEIVLWAAAHEETDAPRDLVRAMRTDKAAFLAQLRAKWQVNEG
jgi:DNA-binding HxlR family transcriptional regulator